MSGADDDCGLWILDRELISRFNLRRSPVSTSSLFPLFSKLELRDLGLNRGLAGVCLSIPQAEIRNLQ